MTDVRPDPLYCSRLPRSDFVEAEYFKALCVEEVLIGGNHLALIIGHDHPPYSATDDEALDHYGNGDKYNAWICWKRIMHLRDLIDD